MTVFCSFDGLSVGFFGGFECGLWGAVAFGQIPVGNVATNNLPVKGRIEATNREAGMLDAEAEYCGGLAAHGHSLRAARAMSLAS